jgi:riboflavin synthase
MFTGIIEKVFSVAEFNRNKAAAELILAVDDDFEAPIGSSIAVNGACLTVTKLVGGRCSFDVSSETLQKTNLGNLKVGSRVNIERALQAGGRLDGHIVQGHVEGQAQLADIFDEGSYRRLEVDVPRNLAAYLIVKGSICLDGVSLTINKLTDQKDGAKVELMIIPATVTHTNFGDLRVGHKFNLETDILAKHIERLLKMSGKL